MKHLLGRMRKWYYRILEHIDKFLICLSMGRAKNSDDFLVASSWKRFGWPIRTLSLARHEKKGVWRQGTNRKDNLGFMWDSKRMKFTMTIKK